MEENKRNWEKVGKILCKIMWNIFYNSCFIWLAVNLFFLAFNFQIHLTFAQSMSISFLYLTLGTVFGIGGSSK